MAFFKELRRRSRASFRTSDSSQESTNQVPTQGSSSTLNSSYGASTPSSTHPTNASSTQLRNSKSNGEMTAPPVPLRPAPAPNSNRNSMMTLSPSGTAVKAPPPTSIYAPRITSIIDNSVVYQKLLLIHGEIGNPHAKPMDGNVTINHDKDGVAFPPTNWPVADSFFKALVYLSPGWNKIRLDFTSPKLSSSSRSFAHSSHIMLNYLPLNSAPPLQLVLLLGNDSPGTFDATPSKIESEGNDLSLAIRKFRMAAHLWQAFTAEQMHRHKFGRRCFRFDEEWQRGTLSTHDWERGSMKNEAKVHIVRCDKTVAELRNLAFAQQYGPAERKDDLYTITADAVRKYFDIKPGQRQFVAALILDSHWDQQANTVTAHAALGGGSQELGLAIFGSHALQSYPSCLEEVVPAFMNCTKTDTNFVANDANESGSSWEAANIGIGAHLHEVGHLFGSPHQEYGVMLRDYVRLNRTFCIRESYCTRTQSPGLRLCRPQDECAWHRLDALRFRFHSCFRVPSDEPLPSDDNVQSFPIGGGRLLFMAASGITFVELYTEGDDLCKHWLEFISPDPRNANLPKQVILSESELRAKLPENKRKAKLRIDVFAGSSRSIRIDDFNDVLTQNTISLPAVRQAPRKDEGLTMTAYNNMVDLGRRNDGRQGFKSKMLGASSMEGTMSQEIIFESAVFQTKLLTSVKAYTGAAVDGIEFCYEDGQTQLLGKRNGKTGDEFFLDVRRGETILGFYVRSGAWIDGVEILTSSGRRSGVYGNALGGEPYTLMAPRGYFVAGVAGTCGQWMDGFQIIITR